MNDEIDERDSEDPDDEEERKSRMKESEYTQQLESELSESRSRPYDPVLEQRIADIKRGGDPSHRNDQTTGPTLTNDTNKNLSKLEEVLKR